MKKIINKKTGILVGITAVIIIAAVILSTTLSRAMTLDQAKELAKGYVPATAGFITSEEETTKFEVMFRDEASKISYEVEVSKDQGSVRKVETQSDNDLGSKTVKLTEEQVKEIVKKTFDGVTGVTVTLNSDDNLYEYEAGFKSDNSHGSADINPETGAIMESTVKFGTAVTVPDSGQDSGTLMTAAEAKALIIKETSGTIKDIDLERINGKYFYEFELIKDGMECEYIVDAKSGQVTLVSEHKDFFDDYDDHHIQGQGNSSANSQTPSTPTDQNISSDEARNIVLAKIPGATIVKINLDYDDGIYVYEGEAVLGEYEYDFEINAASGVVIDWDQDRMDYDD